MLPHVSELWDGEVEVCSEVALQGRSVWRALLPALRAVQEH